MKLDLSELFLENKFKDEPDCNISAGYAAILKVEAKQSESLTKRSVVFDLEKV